MTPPQRFCEDHKVMAYQMEEVHRIIRGWQSLGRKVFAGLLIAAIIGAVTTFVAVEVHMQSANAQAQPAQVTTP